MLQCIKFAAVCGIVLQYVVACCSVSLYVAECCSMCVCERVFRIVNFNVGIMY